MRHPRLAADLLDVLRGLGASEIRSRTDVVVIDASDATDPAQHDGPAGLPLRAIAVSRPAPEAACLATDLDVLADPPARSGRHPGFRATVTLVTVVARH